MQIQTTRLLAAARLLAVWTPGSDAAAPRRVSTGLPVLVLPYRCRSQLATAEVATGRRSPSCRHR